MGRNTTKKTASKIGAGLVCVLLISACAGDKDRYPLLAIRDVERVQGQFAPPAPATPVASPKPITSKAEIAQMVANAERAFAKFETARPGARDAVYAGRGKPADSLAYSGALLALAELSSLQSETTLALGDLDLLASQAATQFAPIDEISAAQAQVLNLIDQQDNTLKKLEEVMGL